MKADCVYFPQCKTHYKVNKTKQSGYKCLIPLAKEKRVINDGYLLNNSHEYQRTIPLTSMQGIRVCCLTGLRLLRVLLDAFYQMKHISYIIYLVVDSFS